MVALACGIAGSAAGEPDVPEFDDPIAFIAPSAPEAIAATPVGYDLVGSSESSNPNEPDGFAEIAVAGNELDDAGWVWFYRNNSTPSDPEIDLVPFLTLDVFDAVGLSYGGDFARIRDIALANLTDGDTDPDLIVAISYDDPNNAGQLRGRVASFEAVRVAGALTEFRYIYDEDFDYPITGLTVGQYSTDGRNQVLAACETSGAVGSLPSRVFVLENQYDMYDAPNFGKLVPFVELANSPTGNTETHSIVAGQFTNIVTGSMGGGLTGNTLDFASFGAGSDGITLGIGNGTGAFSFTLNPVYSASCSGTPHGFGEGASGSLLTNTVPIVNFDPFSNIRKSLATPDDAGVSLIHYDPRFGGFSHLCDGSGSLDYYLMEPEDCTTPESIALNAATPHLATGTLNGDVYDDLVYINPLDNDIVGGAFAAFLLGRGVPGSDGRIMFFDNCVENGHYVPYESTESGGLDRVLCVNLNNDGFDEVLITRGRTYELIVLKNITN